MKESADGSFTCISAKSGPVLKEARCELWVKGGRSMGRVLDRGMRGIGHISALSAMCPKVEVACERVKSHG